jgi:hypothetical protein
LCETQEIREGHYEIERQVLLACVAVLMMMSAVPAVVQFEVSPDNFNDNPSSSRQVARSNSMTDLKLQIAEHRRSCWPVTRTAFGRNPLWRESLASPVCDAQLALSRLERQQQTLRSLAGCRHASGSTTAVVSASNDAFRMKRFAHVFTTVLRY